MKIVAITALATITVAAVDPLAEISAHWDALTDIIEDNLPILQAADPSLYAVATSIIGGTEITQSFNSDLVQQVATAFPPALLNNILSRAGVTGFSADGNPLPTGGAGSASSVSTSSPTPTAISASSKATSAVPLGVASSGAASPTNTSSSGKPSSSASGTIGKLSAAGKSSASGSSSASGKSSSTSGASKVLAGSLGAAIFAAAGFF